MRRRALLASLGVGFAGLAGCVESSTGPETTTTDDSTTHTTTGDEPPEPPEGYASIVDLETGPRTYALSSVRRRTDDGGEVACWFDRTATADGPAVLTGYLRNANDFENTFRVEWLPGVGSVHTRQPRGYDHEARLHLAPTERNELATEIPDVTRDESGYWRVEDVGPWFPETYRMAPGEVVELEYAVVGEPGMDGRPTGTYTLEFDDDDGLAIAVWDTDSPGPGTDSRFAGRDLPDFEGESTTAWFHDADESTPVYLEPSTERLELDGLVEFEALNHSRETVRCGHWNLYKLADGEWFHVGPTVHTSDCRMLHPGGREQWSLRAFNGEPVPTGGDCHEGFTRGYLGGGEYAAVAGYGHPEDESAALVEFVGAPVEVVPTADATRARDGATVTVTTEQYGDGDEDATLTLERTDSADERLLAEQVMRGGQFGSRHTALRDALAAFAAGVDVVHVQTGERAVDRALGYDETERRFTFRGQAYVATATSPDS
jgi:hypothetical protein